MIRKLAGSCSLCVVAGCFTIGQQSPTVPADPFGHSPPVTAGTRAAYAPAPLESAARVDALGRKILAANPQIGLRPQFRTIGSPEIEVFHQGTADVLLTDGLVKQCTTDGQLAAVLCTELGKMVAEREVLAGPQLRSPDRLPPMEVRVGNDNVGAATPDLTYVAELGKFEQEQRKRSQRALSVLDAQALARDYLTKAGFAESDLQAVQPSLRSAADNATFSRQLNPATPAATPRTWTH